tara:strand:- start:1556 stop:2074 length:519 start_codon:yes stop_codon:yes gene_type:complete
MKVGLIGSDYINEDISNRLIANDIEVWGYQNDYSKSEEQYEKGSLSGCVTSLEYLSDVIRKDKSLYASVGKTSAVYMVSVPNESIDDVIKDLLQYCLDGDVIINHCVYNLSDNKRRTEMLSKLGIQFIDCDTSNDSVVISGPSSTMTVCSPIFRALAPQSKWSKISSWIAVL